MSEYDECGDKDDDRSETDIQVFYERHLGVGRWFRGPQLMPRRFILTGACRGGRILDMRRTTHDESAMTISNLDAAAKW